jgi:hypothetical protein
VTHSKTTKHFETSERSPSLRLRDRTYSESKHRFVFLEERRRDGWARVGSVDLGWGPADTRGVCTDAILDEWDYTEFHANGDRVRVGRRLRKQFDLNNLEIVLEEERDEVLGFGDREEHDWRPVDLWRFEGPGGGSR